MPKEKICSDRCSSQRLKRFNGSGDPVRIKTILFNCLLKVHPKNLDTTKNFVMNMYDLLSKILLKDQIKIDLDASLIVWPLVFSMKF